jgi:hypothetical protein
MNKDAKLQNSSKLSLKEKAVSLLNNVLNSSIGGGLNKLLDLPLSKFNKSQVALELELEK